MLNFVPHKIEVSLYVYSPYSSSGPSASLRPQRVTTETNSRLTGHLAAQEVINRQTVRRVERRGRRTFLE